VLPAQRSPKVFQSQNVDKSGACPFTQRESETRCLHHFLKTFQNQAVDLKTAINLVLTNQLSEGITRLESIFFPPRISGSTNLWDTHHGTKHVNNHFDGMLELFCHGKNFQPRCHQGDCPDCSGGGGGPGHGHHSHSSGHFAGFAHGHHPTGAEHMGHAAGFEHFVGF
jgi:hypothetical protein